MTQKLKKMNHQQTPTKRQKKGIPFRQKEKNPSWKLGVAAHYEGK